MLDFILDRANYWAVIGLMMIGLYITFEATNMIKRLVGLSIFQTSVVLFYITLSKVSGGTAPILIGADAAAHDSGSTATEHGGGAAHGALETVYSNPLPHVLMLTAIVVGVSTLAVGLAIVVRIREAYGSVESDEVRATDVTVADAEDADVPATQGAS